MTWVALYAGCILLANGLTVWLGLIPVGFGLYAPAGVAGAGLSFTARDVLQDRLGSVWTVWAILLGAGLSALLSPALGLASGAAFLLAETLDFAVYTPLRRRHWLLAVVLSNTIGAAADTVCFLYLAFGATTLWPGQMLGKLAMTALVLPFLWRRRREPLAR